MEYLLPPQSIRWQIGLNSSLTVYTVIRSIHIDNMKIESDRMAYACVSVQIVFISVWNFFLLVWGQQPDGVN